ncbi:MAG: PilZ domain-containing protein [Desulfuromonadales bacterium]|nr:PilZ domain-containing protein [Desulfuromonadales bacterium]
MAEKRFATRRGKRIKLLFGVDAPTRMAFTEDITREGLFIRTPLVIKTGTHVKVELHSPEGPIKLVAQVRWGKKIPQQLLHTLKGGMGLKIIAFQAGEEIYENLCTELYGAKE